MLYNLPKGEQLGFMKKLVDDARAGNSKLRRILSNKYLRHPPKDAEWLYPYGCHLTIAQSANRYCWRYWGANVTDVVYGRCEEPETGEVI